MNVVSLLLSLAVCAGAAARDTTEAAAAGEAPAEDRYANSACVKCHREQEGRLKEIVDEWTESVHYENNVSCRGCHGGDATLTREEFATDDEFEKTSHASFSPEYRFLQNRGGARIGVSPEGAASLVCRECHTWSTERGLGNPHGDTAPADCTFKRFGGVAMSRERGIAYICATCHPKTTEKQLGSPHGSRGAPSCLFCHGGSGHATPPATIDIIDPRPREERGRCSQCHEPGTMNAVAYIRKTLEKTAELIKISNEQFEQLEQMGYRSLGLGEMHTHVGETRANLRKVQHGCNVGEINELAKSIGNVAKRTAHDYQLVQALHNARRMQTKVAIGVAGLLLMLATMLLLYKRAFCITTGTWTTQIPSRRTLTPPCNNACPAGNNVQGFIVAAAREEYDRALEVLLETTPFPGVCGRVCPAPCMDACNRKLFDESIDIRELERCVGDHGRWKGATKPTRDERIAVVGSGPAGLSVTYHLARLGYRTTLFERDDELGGAMRTGLPTYRLPHDVLDREIGRILEYGVTVRTGQLINRQGLLRMSHEYAAVFVATGLQLPRTMDLGEVAPDTLQQGLRFLERARNGKADLDGKDVVVIGGGNVAIDVARTALRLSAASVRLYCLESRNEMPAHAEEIEKAVAEGTEINTGWGPVAVLGDHGNAKGIEFRRCLAVFDECGTFAPSFDEKDRITVDADTVFLALGQTADLSILPEGSEMREGEVILGLTGAPILAVGDFAASEGTVTAAIGSGRRVAWHIHRTITGQDLFSPAPGPIATPFDIKMYSLPHDRSGREQIPAPDMQRTEFSEADLGLADKGEHRPALAEAQRCFSCGVCNQCDRCLIRCPEGIIMREGDDYHVDYAYCKSCGMCAAECPRGVIYMAEL